MKKIQFILALASFCFFLTSCTPEFSQIAEYKDITTVFGLLNISEDTQYVKIQKAFLTNGNAYEEAKNPHNLYYYDTIDVQLEEIINKRVIKTIPLKMTTSVPKDPGTFANPEQVLYYTTEKLNTDATYKLLIRNKETGKEVEGETSIVGNFSIMAPMTSMLNMTVNKSLIKFYTAKNAAVYDVYMQFHYIEVDKETRKVLKDDGLIRWKIGSYEGISGATTTIQYMPINFFNIVANNLSPDPNIIRYAPSDCLEIEVSAAEQNYKTYLDVNAPSSSIVQDKLEFTNMKTADGTAYGIFSSRNITKRSYDLHYLTEDSLVYGAITKNLGFRKYGLQSF